MDVFLTESLCPSRPLQIPVILRVVITPSAACHVSRADTACLRAPTTVPVEKIRTWLIETNTALAGTGVRVLGRMSVPRDLHAEAHTTRRRYEYLVPAWLFDGKADGPWTGPARGEVALIPLLKRLRELAFRPFGSCNVRTDRRRRRCPLWHNFSAEAVPHSPSAARRLFRFYAHDTVVVQDVDYVCLSVSGDAFVDRQVRGMVGLAVAGARGLIGSAEIASCIDPTRQEDLFLVPLAPVSPCWLAEVGYATWQTKLGGGVCMSPGAAQRSAPPLEGWSDETTRADAVSFRRRVIQSAAGWWQTPQQHLGAVWLRDTLEPGATKLVAELKAANERTTMFNGNPGSNTIGDNNGSALAAESRQHKLSPEELNSLPSGAPAAYQEVLRLLREADTSGLWPASTAARNSVISGGGAGEDSGKEACASSSSVRIQSSSDGETEEDEDVNNGEGGDGRETAKDKQTEEETEEEADSVQKPQRGGSFTVGAYPPPYPPPRGNKIFPALTRAAFDLEAALMPNRPPSSTIAVNRHARFRPHIDNGAGAGQSVSLIVGLGDYVGGELVVEGEEVNIRYNPLEFNGWTQRHWTRPFKGERYSLVWFTPKGCEGMTNGAYLFQEKENGPNGVAVVVDESTVSEDGLQVHEGNQQELH